MANLSSGLPENISDEEQVARFLASSSQFNATMVKPSAFLPEPVSRETSVFRHGDEPRNALWEIGEQYVTRPGRNIHGAAILKASDARIEDLRLLPDEPPPKHAVITNWPWRDDDPALQKARQKLIATLLAGKAILFRR